MKSWPKPNFEAKQSLAFCSAFYFFENGKFEIFCLLVLGSIIVLSKMLRKPLSQADMKPAKADQVIQACERLAKQNETMVCF